jgi:hypothetical protein
MLELENSPKPYAHLLQAHPDGLNAQGEYENIHFDGLDIEDAQAGNKRLARTSSVKAAGSRCRRSISTPSS